MLMSLAALGYVIADVAADGLTVQYAQSIYLVSPVLVQMWAAGEPGPDADLATVGVGAVPLQMLRGRAQSRCRCGRLGQG